MATPIDQEFFARLNALNEKFAAGIPSTMARLQQARDRFDASAPDQDLVGELHQVLHTIAGSAATFGFRVLGQEARHLEQRLRVMMAYPAIAARDWLDWIDALDEYIAWALRNPKAADYPGTVEK
jgi:HPt (histidine-containing phosphotransfer) domain-containing protein